jgi:hypothetical protein
MNAMRYTPFLAMGWLLLASIYPSRAVETWEQSRALKDFPSLLERSPFSLPTAEEKVAPEDRFYLAGAATMGGEQVVFIWDKNTQQRLLLREGEDSSGNKLLEFIADPNPKNMRAKVQISGQTADVRFLDAAFVLSQAPEPPPAKGPAVATNAQAIPNSKIMPGTPESEMPRRVIRRRVISGSPPPNTSKQ